MNAQEALTLLSAVPADDFITDSFSDRVSKCCGIGHLQRLTSEDPSDYSFKNCTDRPYFMADGTNDIRMSSKSYIEKAHNHSAGIEHVNNGDHINGYNEPAIKDRVLHLLTDMVAAGY